MASFGENEIDESINAIDLLRTLGGDTGPASARAFLTDKLGGLDAFDYVAEDAISPACVSARANNVGILCVHGTDLSEQYVPQVVGWLNPGFLGQGGPVVTDPRNPWIVTAGLRAFLSASRARVWETYRLYVIGHSAGHGISSEAMNEAFLRSMLPERAQTIKNISFGGNGWGNARKIATFGRSVEFIRWMVAEDPCPLFPWCTTQMLGGNTFLAPDTLRSILNVQHMNGGRDLPASGGFTWRTLPSAAVAAPGASVVSWLRSIDQGTENPHQTREYRRRIDMLPRPVGDREAPPVVRGADDIPTASEPPLNLPLVETASQAASLIVQLVGASVAANEALPVPVPVVLPNFSFVARKGNGVWGVERGGVQISTPGTKKAAKGLARKLNRLEADVGAIDDPTLLEALAFYTS